MLLGTQLIIQIIGKRKSKAPTRFEDLDYSEQSPFKKKGKITTKPLTDSPLVATTPKVKETKARIVIGSASKKNILGQTSLLKAVTPTQNESPVEDSVTAELVDEVEHLPLPDIELSEQTEPEIKTELVKIDTSVPGEENDIGVPSLVKGSSPVPDDMVAESTPIKEISESQHLRVVSHTAVSNGSPQPPPLMKVCGTFKT